MSGDAVPLCVALEGALTRVNFYQESLLAHVRRAPIALLTLPIQLIRDRSALHHQPAAAETLDAARMPLNLKLLDWLAAQKAAGRRLVLVTHEDLGVANALALHLKLFDELLVSRSLRERFAPNEFDYVGSHSSPESRLARQFIDAAARFPPDRSVARAWIDSLRLHQWAKNVLVFLPALFSHRILESGILIRSALAFFAFSLCASSVYLVNDLLDLTADREHPRKRLRPFAAGQLTAGAGLVVSIVLFAVALSLALVLGLRFAAVLSAYYAFTWAYSLRLKHIALVDVMALAALYTFRVVAGSTATSIPISFWLLAFSIFMFLSLAIAKRYAEIDDAKRAGQQAVADRGYTAADLPFLLSIGVASGYCTVVVMAFYINSIDSTILYQHRKPLWVVCPLLLFWISRVWLYTARGLMPDDPVIFALRDRGSWIALGIIALTVFVAL